MVRLPKPGEIGIAVKTTTRVEIRAEPAPQPAVALVGAPVVEFFGIPLADANDVVFVLDVSGSMDELAQGRLAEIAAAPPPTTAPTAPPPGAPPPGQPPDGSSGQPSPPADSAPPPTAPPASQPSGHRKIDVAQSELIDALSRLPQGTRMNVVFFNSDVDGFAPDMFVLDEPARERLVVFVKETTATGSTALAPAMRVAFLMNAHRIVLLSDGLGNVGGNAQSVLRDAREAMHGGVRIDTIGVGASQDRDLLSTLARESGGLYQAL